MENYKSPSEALNDLRKRGYDADFEPQSNCLYCSILDLRLNEEEFQIDEVHRFEGDSDSGGNTIVYALTSPTGVKGTIVNELELFSGNFNF